MDGEHKNGGAGAYCRCDEESGCHRQKEEGIGRKVREEVGQCTLPQMVCIHPFQTLTLTPTKLTFPEKLLHN